MILADWLKILAILAVAVSALYVGRKLVAKLDDLRAEVSRAAGGLTQVGTDLAELAQRIADSVAAGDPTDADIAAVAAIADGLISKGTEIDSLLAPVAPPPVEPPVEPPA